MNNEMLRNPSRSISFMYGLCGYPLWRCANVHMQALGCVYASWVFGLCFFQVGGDEDESAVGEEGPVEPVVAGGGLAVALLRLKMDWPSVCWTGS